MPRVARWGCHSASDLHSEHNRGFDWRTPRRSRNLYKVVCILHICYLSASPSFTLWIWFPTSLSCCSPPLTLSFLLSGGHPCPRHLFRSVPHTETEGGREGDAAQKEHECRREENKNDLQNLLSLTFLDTLLSCLLSQRNHRSTFLFYSTEMSNTSIWTNDKNKEFHCCEIKHDWSQL